MSDMPDTSPIPKIYDIDIPGTYDANETSEGFDLVSAASGMVVSVSCRSDRPTYSLKVPANPAAEALSFSTDQLSELYRAYAESWIIWVETEIGLGFHPDTPADAYDPPLPLVIEEHYDEMIGFADQHLDDMYATAVDTAIRMGWHEGPLPESAAGQAFLRGARPH